MGPDHTTPPRVLVVASTDRRRGAEVFSERLRDGLRARGWTVDAVALLAGGDATRADLDLLTDVPAGSVGRLSPAIVAALRGRLRRDRPDVVVANGGATLRYAVAATTGFATKLAYVAIGEPSYWFRSSVARFVNRSLVGRPDLVLAVSDATRRQLVDLRPSVADRVVVAHQGVPDEWFAVECRPGAGPLLAVMVGSLSPEKDPVLAVRAVAATSRTRLRFVGDGPLAADVTAEADRLGVSDRVECVGSTADVRGHVEDAGALLLTSRTEGLPGVVMEAMAAGLAVVTVDVGGVREAVVDGRTGIVVERDAGAIAAALDRLDGDEALRGALGQAGRNVATERFTMAAAIDRYAAALEGLAP